MESTNVAGATGVYADRRLGSENGFRSIVKNIKHIFAAQNLETTSLLSLIDPDLRRRNRLRGNLDRDPLSGTRRFISWWGSRSSRR